MQLQPRHVKISALWFGKVLKQMQLFMSEMLSEQSSFTLDARTTYE